MEHGVEESLCAWFDSGSDDGDCSVGVGVDHVGVVFGAEVVADGGGCGGFGDGVHWFFLSVVFVFIENVS